MGAEKRKNEWGRKEREKREEEAQERWKKGKKPIKRTRELERSKKRKSVLTKVDACKVAEKEEKKTTKDNVILY